MITEVVLGDGVTLLGVNERTLVSTVEIVDGVHTPPRLRQMSAPSATGNAEQHSQQRQGCTMPRRISRFLIHVCSISGFGTSLS